MNPLFWDSLYNKIKDSILNEGPQDRIFEEIQKTPKPDIPAVVDRLISLSPTLDTENQLFRFFLYLRKFSEYFGTGIIQPYGSALLGYLESRYQGVVEVVLEMVKDLMGNEEAFREMVFKEDFGGNPNCNYRKVVLAFGEAQFDMFLSVVTLYIRSADPSKQSYGLQLLSTIVQQENPKLHSISDKDIINVLLDLLENSTVNHIISMSMLTLIMLIPFLLDNLPKIIGRLFSGFSRVLCWANSVDTPVPQKMNVRPRSETASSGKAWRRSHTDPLPRKISGKPLLKKSDSQIPTLHPPTDPSTPKPHLLELDTPQPDPQPQDPKPDLSSTLSDSNSLLGNESDEFEMPEMEEMRDSVYDLEGEGKSGLVLCSLEDVHSSSLMRSDGGGRKGDGAATAHRILNGRREKEKKGGKGRCVGEEITVEAKKKKPVLRKGDKKDLPLPDGPKNSRGISKDLQYCIAYMFIHLYGLFPANFIKFIRKEYEMNPSLKFYIQPLFDNTKFNTLFLEINETDELSRERWRSTDPRQIIAEYLGPNSYQNLIMLNETLTALLGVKEGSPEANLNLPAVSVSVGNSDPLSDNITQQSIIKMQRILETKLYSEFIDGFWKGKEKPVSLMEQNTSKSDYENKILILENKLLFERYLQTQYLRRISGINKNDNTIRILEDKISELKMIIEEQNSYKEELNKAYRKQFVDYHKLKNVEIQLRDDIVKITNEETGKNNVLLEESQQLRLHCQHLMNEINDLKKLNNEKETRIFKLESQVQNASEHIKAARQYKKIIESLNDELLIWEQKRTFLHQHQQKIENLEQILEEKNQTISKLSQNLYQSIDTIGTMRSRQEEFHVKIGFLEEELSMEKSKSLDFKNLLERQQQTEKVKIDSIRNTYMTTKMINIGLEKKIVQLHTELENYKEKIMNSSPVPTIK
eukprot:TRINITY_DN4156_c0_g1_i2.p1 TRINITY_DN4156_c0_g1~~TRINITY_DN4156_c0_g1_i2.p1  ORF type:complete len:923 (-),score=249.39 TRINITY_DN4156_c0_g1_i2:145-2913(-)